MGKRERREYSFEIREQAETLYVEEGRTFEEVSRATGVSVSQLRLWARRDKWHARRDEYRENRRTAHAALFRLRAKALQRALETVDPQDINAAIRLEQAYRTRAGRRGGEDRPAIFLDFLEELIIVFREVAPEGVRLISENYDAIIEGFKKHETAP